MFPEHLEQKRRQLEQQLRTLMCDSGFDHPPLKRLLDAGLYTLQNGGKRVRPLLTIAAAEAVDRPFSQAALDYVSCAIEMLHTYSLVHDDLPAMDDDDLRRGKPSCHKAYDEATAILVGDALQARAFELIGRAPVLAAAPKVQLLTELSQAVGFTGMVGGQAIDIGAVDSSLDIAQLQDMHQRKTGALIVASVRAGGIVAGASAPKLDALARAGEAIGLAFQVVDDILDVTADTETLGKTQGKDAAANKPTYVSLLGLDGAREAAKALHAQTQDALEPFGAAGFSLTKIADYILERSY